MKIGRKRIRKVKIDDRYSVSDDGLVWSGELPLEPINGEGVNLHGKRVKIAYLVARAFVSNSMCRQYIRHKDGDRTNNRADNLEWCDEPEPDRRGRKPMLRWMTGRISFFQSQSVSMMARPSKRSRLPWNIASRVEIISDFLKRRGRARK